VDLGLDRVAEALPQLLRLERCERLERLPVGLQVQAGLPLLRRPGQVPLEGVDHHVDDVVRVVALPQAHAEERLGLGRLLVKDLRPDEDVKRDVRDRVLAVRQRVVPTQHVERLEDREPLGVVRHGAADVDRVARQRFALAHLRPHARQGRLVDALHLDDDLLRHARPPQRPPRR
jgi:hypothetical protein